MKSIESIDKTAKSTGAFDSINYGVYCPRLRFMLNAWLYVRVINFLIIIIIIMTTFAILIEHWFVTERETYAWTNRHRAIAYTVLS